MTPDEALAALRLEQRIRRARVDLVTWCELAGPTERGPFAMKRWQRDLCARLQEISERVAAGIPVRAQVESPTQTGKSEIVRRWLAWHLACYGQSIGFGSYEGGLATEHSTAIRAMLRSQVALRVWPHLTKNKGDEFEQSGEKIQDRANDWSIPAPHADQRPARFVARGRRGGMTGRFLQLIVPDDLLMDEAEYNSAAAREEAWSWYRSQAEGRVSENNGSIVMIGSRWGSDDVHARARKIADQGAHPVEVMSYPLVAKAGDLMGRAPGEYLTDQWDEKKEARVRAIYGARLSAANLDCAPIDESGGTFKKEFFSKTYTGNPADVARICDWHVLALDGAETAGAGDWSVLTWVGRRQGAYLKLGQWRQQVELPELLALVRNVIAEVRPHGTLVEVKSSGKAVYQTLSREIPGLVAVQKSRGKRDCYLAASPVFEGGSWLMPATAQPWQQGYTERMTAITGLKDGEVDDEADADVMVVLWDQERQAKDNAPTAGGLLALLRGGR